MADEIAQVVDLEYKGIYYLLKGTKAMIAAMVSGIKTLSEWNHKKWLDKPGSCSWQKIQEVSEGMAPILEFPKEMFEPTVNITNDPDVQGSGRISPFEYYCRKNNLRYCMMPDLNPNDDYIPVAVPAQDFGIHDEQIKSYMRKRIEHEESRDKSYAERIDDAKERLDKADSQDEKDEINREIEALESGKNQNSELLAESKEKMEHGNVIDLSDYLKQAEDAGFTEDPDRSMYQAQTCGVVREYMSSDCMYPIRDPGLVPESGELLYSQKTGEDTLITVKRTFHTDDKGLAYSTYLVSDPVTGLNIASVSDKGLSAEAWKDKRSMILGDAGMIADQPLIVLKSDTDLADYVLSLNENFNKAHTDGPDISEEARADIERARADAAQREAYARSFYQSVSVPTEAVMTNDKNIISLEFGDGLVEGITLTGMDKDNARISIKTDEKYTFKGADGKEASIKGSDILKTLKAGSEAEIAEKVITKAAKR